MEKQLKKKGVGKRIGKCGGPGRRPKMPKSDNGRIAYRISELADSIYKLSDMLDDVRNELYDLESDLHDAADEVRQIVPPKKSKKKSKGLTSTRGW